MAWLFYAGVFLPIGFALGVVGTLWFMGWRDRDLDEIDRLDVLDDY